MLMTKATAMAPSPYFDVTYCMGAVKTQGLTGQVEHWRTEVEKERAHEST
jgi:hypothetical protein